MSTQPSFPQIFNYYAIHDTIRDLVSASNGDPVDVDQVARQVREAYPDLGMLPATLRAAIKRVIRSQSAGSAEKGPRG
jgi:hypothetical protein